MMRQKMRLAKKRINRLLRQTKGQKPMTKVQKKARREANEALFLIGGTMPHKREEVESTVVAAADNLRKAFETEEEK